MTTQLKLKSKEHLEQTALIQWAKANERKYPALCNLFAIPNGGKLPYVRVGKGKIWSGQRFALVREGLKRGVPDLFLAVAIRPFNGLFIEMKHGKNKPSSEQIDWINRLTEANYACKICYSFEDARDTILAYLMCKVL